MKAYRRILLLLLPLLSASLAFFVFPPVNIYPLAFLMLAPLFIFLVLENNFWLLMAGGFLFRFLYGYILTNYIFEPVLYLQSIFIFLGLPLAVYFLKKLGLFHPLGFWITALLYLLIDYLEANYTLVPAFVIQIGNALGMSPFVGLARLGQLWALGFFVVFLNAIMAKIILDFVAKKFFWKSMAWRLAVWLAVIGIGLLLSQFFLNHNRELYAGGSEELNFISVSTNEVFDADKSKISASISGLQKTFQEKFRDDKIDLVIFPEGLFEVETSEIRRDIDLDLFRDFAKGLRAALLVNFSMNRNSGRYNTNLLIDRNGLVLSEYDKQDLVFGGEYWPDWIEKLSGYKSRYEIGDGSPILVLNGKKFAVPICFESQNPGRMAEFKNAGADFLINSSSNKWISRFGANGLRRYLGETLSLRRIYAVWLQRPIIISGRLDYAGIILPDGNLETLDFDNQEGYTFYKGRLKLK